MEKLCIVDDIFLFICDMLDLYDVLNIRLLDKHHKQIIHDFNFKNVIYKPKYSNDIYNKLKYITQEFNFHKFDFGNCINLSYNELNLLKNPTYLITVSDNISNINKICDFTTLKHLQIYSNTAISEVDELKNLTSLNLWEITITNINFFKELVKLTNLKSLNIGRISDSDSNIKNNMNEICKMVNLKSLNISSNNLFDRDVKELNKLTKLKKLYIGDKMYSGGNNITNDTLILITQMIHLF